jgi:hypothetical protein
METVEKICRGTWNDYKKVIVLRDGHTWARGLTKTLSACFSPEFSISVVLKGVKEIKKKKRGKFTGNLVDNQISVWVNQNKILENRDPRFDMIFDVLNKKRWNPLVSQLDLACTRLRLGTRVDLVCENDEGEVILVEIKCGFDDYYDVNNGQGNMLAPFEDVTTTFRKKHFLQLWMTSWLFNHCVHAYNHMTFKTAYVLRIFENSKEELESELTELPVWLTADTERLEACLKILEGSKNTNKKKRNSEMANGAQTARRRFIRRKMDSKK